MPGFITHYICAQAVLGKVGPEVSAALRRHAAMYNIGAQGPDVFYYYVPGLIKKRTQGVGAQLHRENPGGFLLAMADHIRGVRREDTRQVVLAYASGFVTHYALDASAHPYVYARTTVPERAALHNRAAHRRLETVIDVLMLKLLSGEQPGDYTLWRLINADAAHMRLAANAVSAALASVYHRDVRAREVYKAMRYMVQLTRLLQSAHGRRKRALALAENLTLGADPVSALIHAQAVDDGRDYLNMKKAAWHTRRNDSFVELYRAAVDEARGMVDGLHAYARGELTRNAFIACIGNRSLQTGETWVHA